MSKSTADVDRWCAGFHGLGWSRAEAEAVAERAQELQEADPDIEWEHHLDQAITEILG
jgi:hypothetical protein